MATRYWVDGGGDGNWATAANWDSAVAAAPTTNDTAIIGTSNRAIIGGTVATDGIIIIVTEGFGGTIGADAPLIFSGGSTGTTLTYGGRGAYANFGLTKGLSAKVNISGGQQFILSSGTMTGSLDVSGGVVTIAAAAIVPTLNNVAGVVTAGYNGTQFTTVTNSGTLYLSRNVGTGGNGTLNCNRGTVVQYNNGVTTFTQVSGTVNIQNGATYNKQSGGTDTTINAFPGSKFTITGNAGNSASTVTVTTLNEWSGSQITDSVNGINLTVTTRNKVGPTTSFQFNGG